MDRAKYSTALRRAGGGWRRRLGWRCGGRSSRRRRGGGLRRYRGRRMSAGRDRRGRRCSCYLEGIQDVAKNRRKGATLFDEFRGVYEDSGIGSKRHGLAIHLTEDLT